MFYLPSKYLEHPLTIHVVGVGGTGGWVANRLAVLYRALRQINPDVHLIRKICLYDDKVVTPANLVRCAFTQHDVGHNKAQVMAMRLNMSLNEQVFEGYATQYTRAINDDLIITCTDTASSRLTIAKNYSSLWLDTGVDEATGYCVLGSKGNELPDASALFRLNEATDTHKAPSCSALESLQRQPFGINDIIASYAVQIISELLLKGQITNHGVIVDLKTLISSPIPVSNEVWESYGVDCSNFKNVS